MFSVVFLQRRIRQREGKGRKGYWGKKETKTFMEKGPERYKNWGREGGKREGWKEGGRGERKKGTELFYLAALPYSKHYVLGGDIKPYIWNAAKKKKKRGQYEFPLFISFVGILTWNIWRENGRKVGKFLLSAGSFRKSCLCHSAPWSMAGKGPLMSPL